jgi:hypothetical protein
VSTMNDRDLSEAERDEVAVLALLELLQQFGDPLRRPGKVLPWPNSEKKPRS